MEEIVHSRRKWDIHMLKIAKLCSEMSKDPSTKVGAVIASKDNKIIATGYNGFPKDVPDYKDWYDNRIIKYNLILHAEENAISNRNTLDIGPSSTIYVYPLRTCLKCYTLLKKYNINRFVSVEHKHVDDRCLVCNKDINECATNRWPTTYYTEDDEVVLISYDELQ